MDKHSFSTNKTDAILEEAYIEELEELEARPKQSVVYFSQISSRPSEDDVLEEDEW